MDDAFITYRYAQNLAHGEGFVYNPSERVQGTSTPLYTIALAGCAGLVGTDHIPAASRTIAFIADVTSLVILWRLLSGFSEAARFITCRLFAMYPKVVLVSISGMETSLVVMLMLVSYLLLFELRRTGVAFLVFLLLLLCRIDGIIWIAVCLWRIGWSQAKRAFRAAVVAAGIYAVWLIFSLVYWPLTALFSFVIATFDQNVSTGGLVVFLFFYLVTPAWLFFVAPSAFALRSWRDEVDRRKSARADLRRRATAPGCGGNFPRDEKAPGCHCQKETRLPRRNQRQPPGC